MKWILLLSLISHGCADSNQSGAVCEVVNIYCKSGDCPLAYRDIENNVFISKNNCSETIDSVLE